MDAEFVDINILITRQKILYTSKPVVPGLIHLLER